MLVRILFFISFILIPRGLVSAEEISRYDIDLTVNADATVHVIETIRYDFGSQKRHGIYRDIPVKYETRFGDNRSIQIDDVFVADENGRAYNYVVSQEGKNVQIKIGDADTYVTGKNTYVISYDVAGAINYFDTHDELYWNAIGGGWTVPINNVSVHLHVPQIDQIDCFAGAYGSTQSCDTINRQSDQDAMFLQEHIAPGTYMTIVSGIPSGMVYKPTFWENFVRFLLDNWILGLPIGVLFFMWNLWRFRGRDPEGRGTVVPQYDVPDKLSPAEIGMVAKDKLSKVHISALIINLAVHGYIKIVRSKKKTLFSSADYTLRKTEKDISDLEHSDEKMIYEKIFTKHAVDGRVAISKLKDKFYKDMKEIMDTVRENTVQKGYYVKSPKKVRAVYISIGVIIIFLSFFTAMSASFVISGIISGIIIAVFGYIMPRRTKKGSFLQESILGFKLYLETAEKDRIDFHNAPEKNPQKFEEFLPYAIALGVEEEWAKQFEDIYKGNPDWYEGGGTDFSPAILAHDMSNFSTKSTSAMSSAPSSAGSGGSGFGGGGGGGGFGGGGGGSW